MNQQYWMYLSLWNEHGGIPGLALLSADSGTGHAELIAKLDDHTSFGCSYVDEKRGILYLCNEVEKVRGMTVETGSIYAYRINPSDGSLSLFYHYETCAPNPSYLSVDPSGKYLVVAHHSLENAISKWEKSDSGEFVQTIIQRDAPLIVYALREDGSIDRIVDVQKHPIDPDGRPYGSFQHCCVFSPDGKFLAVCDKGDGCLYLYAFDVETGHLALKSRTLTDVPGCHPRYCVFHPTKPYLILNHEQERDHRMMVASFRYTEDGQVEKISEVNVLDDNDVVPPRSHFEQQGIAISPNGDTVYTCVNGPNFIGVLSLDGSGSLTLRQKAPVDGVWPRGLGLMPGGKYLVASCLVSGDILSYEILSDGLLGEGRKISSQKGGAYFSFSSQNP